VYVYRWQAQRKGLFTWWVHCTEGTYLGKGQVRTLVAGRVWGEERALARVREAIQRDRDQKGAWTVTDGGQSVVANLVDIRPPLDGFITPKMRRQELHD
jgi:hypothetical protein